MSMGRDELLKLADSGEDTHVTCQFCDADYAFTPEELRTLLSNQKN